MQVVTPPSPLRNMLVTCASGMGLIGKSRAAYGHVVDALTQREADVRNGDSGKRLSRVKARKQTTLDELAATKAGLEQAEARHFDSLKGEDDTAIESARAEVLGYSSKIGLLQTEIESLKTIEIEALAALGNAFNAEQPKLHADLQNEALRQLQEAEMAIVAAMDGGLLEQFKKLAHSSEVLGLIGSDASGFRAIVNRNQMSQVFGYPNPVNHVSLKAEEFRDVDRHTLEGLRVKV